MRNPRLTILLATVLLTVPARARQSGDAHPDTVLVTLPGLEVRATRMESLSGRPALAVSIVDRPLARRAVEPALALQDVLRGVPGLTVEARGHLALGERIMVRGMGGRAAFGVRGVQVLLDGVPLTLPDGQAVTDIVEPALIRSAEVVRGPSGHLWGNGSGGVVALRTAASTDEAPGLHLRLTGGSFGTRHLLAEAIAAPGRTRIHAFGSHLATEGFREHSAGAVTRAGLHLVTPVGGGSVLRVGVAGAHQDVEHPGSLTPYEMGHTVPGPTGADSRYVGSQSGKVSRQVQGIARLLVPLRGGVLEAEVHGGARDLDNPLPFAWIGVDRRTTGIRTAWQTATGPIALRVGVDLAEQRDDRINAQNVDGRPEGNPSVDQRETVRSAALAGSAVFSLSPVLAVTAGIRLDRLRARLEDRLPDDGDQSGVRTFRALSPAVAIRWSGSSWTTWIGWSTAFDTPTTTELVNSPDGSSAFNPEVGPQRTRGVETGFRVAGSGWSLDFALYALRVRDLLSAFQDAGSGRTYYANADRAVHRGLEGHYQWRPSDRFRFSLTGSVHRFRFDSGPHDGNDLPGLPRGRMDVTVETGTSGVRALAGLTWSSDRFGDDANETRVPGYTVVDLRLFHRGLRTGSATLRPFLALGNVFDAVYAGSLVVNARGGRYNEPSPGRHVTLGLSARFGER